MAGLLSEEDLRDLADSLVQVLEFDTPVERETYIHERGWDSRPERKSAIEADNDAAAAVGTATVGSPPATPREPRDWR